MNGARLRGALAVLLIALAAAILAASPALDRLRGLSIDILTALRWRMYGNAYPPESSAVAVVVLDEETFRTPPFEGTPSVTWTPQIAQVLAAIIDGGASVVGFDVVFSTSIEQSAAPFGTETLGARVRGFDREYLRALASAARAGKVVLGQVQHQSHPLLPSPGQRAAVGFARNIRPLNVATDPDDVIRRVPLRFEVDGEQVASMALDLVSRAHQRPSAELPGAAPQQVPETLILNFQGGADDIPTYSLADLYACALKADSVFFKRQFGGKIVLIGTLLDVEDRKITSKRFASAPEGAHADRCALTMPAADQKFARDSIAGVYIHATAVNNLVRNDALVELGRTGIAVSSFTLALLAGAAALIFGPLSAAVAAIGLAMVWLMGATAVFRHALVLPFIEPIVAAFAALSATMGYRFVVADSGKRLLRQSFALYLAPALIDRMLSANKPPALGGEMRQVSVYFSDIAGFSSMAERTPPADLVAAMNEYLTAMTDVIEQHGGFVDKYIGDAVVAVFGAPLHDPDHATNAVRAALQCGAVLEGLARVNAAFGGSVRHRIGISSGEALVGNIGSRRRFNYTAMGDVVNLASRLEAANKLYGTAVIASESTMSFTGSAFVWRELDAIRVKGRMQPVRIFEPLGASGEVAAELLARSDAYAKGLACYRARDFGAAVQHFAPGAEDDSTSALFLQRAQLLMQNPPCADWEPVSTQEQK
jgi:class 3 adenylate cyclase/CHASE2 domain-containing sensor protein